MFIVEQRPWLGIWLTICFSGIQGEATKRIGERCLDYATNGLAWLGRPMDWFLRQRWLRRCWVRIMRDNTHKGGGDTRTQILHFKENPFFSSVFVFATKKNQNKIVSTCWCDECTTNRQDEDGPCCCVFDCTLCRQNKWRHVWFLLLWFPLTKMVKKILVCEDVTVSHPKLNSVNHIGNTSLPFL